jgi:hypothetical protein
MDEVQTKRMPQPNAVRQRQKKLRELQSYTLGTTFGNHGNRMLSE